MRNSLSGCLRATIMIVSDSKHFSEDSLFLFFGLPPALAVLYPPFVFRFSLCERKTKNK
jgi:hypothetical protein